MSTSPSYTIHPVIRQHAERHGLAADGSLESFLFPKLSDLPNPNLFKSMDKAVSLIVDAVVQEHDILIWGDYDVDGITATALLVLFFEQLGVEVEHYIPNRLTDGYGLNVNVLKKYSNSMKSDKLLITVDCGISNKTEIEAARQFGFKVIVTDHHEVPEDSTPADATINPKQCGCKFPGKNLAGVGVAFYLASAVRRGLRVYNTAYPKSLDINMKSFLAFVAIGTVADMMPLTGVNRLLAKGGFEVITSSENNNITALFDELDISCQHLVSESISFQVAPAINAAGRLGEPNIPLDLLTTKSADRSKKLSTRLVKLNQRRKKISRGDLELALKGLSQAEVEDRKCVVIANDFHDGILGITASRLVDIYHVPVLVCCRNMQERGGLKGSGRAPDGFNLYHALDGCFRYLQKFGGHQAAAGFSLQEENFVKFKKCFEESVSQQSNILSHNTGEIKDNHLDLSISEAFDPVLIDNLLRLEPLGEGNPKPIFIDKETRFVSLKFFGTQNEHIRGMIRGRFKNIPFVGFNLGSKARLIDTWKVFCMKYSHMLDHYRGESRWKIRIENIW